MPGDRAIRDRDRTVQGVLVWEALANATVLLAKAVVHHGWSLALMFGVLGVIESHVGRSFWLSQTESYLDAAIRIAPGAPFAPEAYALLEEFMVSGHSGSAGASIPPEVRQRLQELRALIDSAQGT